MFPAITTRTGSASAVARRARTARSTVRPTSHPKVTASCQPRAGCSSNNQLTMIIATDTPRTEETNIAKSPVHRTERVTT